MAILKFTSLVYNCLELTIAFDQNSDFYVLNNS